MCACESRDPSVRNQMNLPWAGASIATETVALIAIQAEPRLSKPRVVVKFNIHSQYRAITWAAPNEMRRLKSRAMSITAAQHTHTAR